MQKTMNTNSVYFVVVGDKNSFSTIQTQYMFNIKMK